MLPKVKNQQLTTQINDVIYHNQTESVSALQVCLPVIKQMSLVCVWLLGFAQCQAGGHYSVSIYSVMYCILVISSYLPT